MSFSEKVVVSTIWRNPWPPLSYICTVIFQEVNWNNLIYVCRRKLDLHKNFSRYIIQQWLHEESLWFTHFQCSKHLQNLQSKHPYTNPALHPNLKSSPHAIPSLQEEKPKQVPSTRRSMKGTRSSSICVPSQSYQKSDRRSCSIDGVAPNKRLSLSTQGSHEKMERKPSFVQVTERKLSVANISEQFSTFISLSSKMGVQGKYKPFLFQLWRFNFRLPNM